MPLDPETIGVLEDHRRDQRAEKLELGSVWQEHRLVFPSSLGGPYHPRNFYRDWKVLVEQSGLPYIRPRDLRHTYISLMIYAGADVLLIADRVGHSRPSITTDKYGHVVDAQRDAGAMSLSKLLKSKKSEEDQPENQVDTSAEDTSENPEKSEKS